MKIRYDRQDSDYRQMLGDPARRARAETWLRNDSLDAWRHRRMYATLDPLIESFPDHSWLTIGDGRYGTDARYLIEKGVSDVHASDLSDALLSIAHKDGFLPNYSVQNAESLTFTDETFDFVYCKESCHHFPRPYLALYEMLRVCRHAVIVTEPNEPVLSYSPISILRRLRGVTGDSFEPSGNYVYSFSPREFDKLMLALGFSLCAFKGINDYYMDGVEEVPLVAGTQSQRAIRRKVTTQIAIRDLLSRLRLLPYGLMTTVMFKTPPDAGVLARLSRNGFSIHRLPRNPYAVVE